MIVVRQSLLRWIDEIRSLRLERMQGRRVTSEVRAAPVGPPTSDFEGLDTGLTPQAASASCPITGSAIAGRESRA